MPETADFYCFNENLKIRDKSYQNQGTGYFAIMENCLLKLTANCDRNLSPPKFFFVFNLPYS